MSQFKVFEVCAYVSCRPLNRRASFTTSIVMAVIPKKVALSLAYSQTFVVQMPFGGKGIERQH